jgi:tetratricopeptide (TPR) repeat protein
VLKENEATATDVEAALAEAVDLPVDRKREILAREAALAADHYAVLGIKPGAPLEEIRGAYFEASRVFHPDRYFGKQLGSFQGRLERVFKRLADAHSTLIDDAKRDAYLKANPRLRVAVAAAAPARAPTADDDAARQAERRARLARHPYLARGTQAKTLVEEAKVELKSGAADRAMGLVQRATQLDPRQKAAGPVRDAAQAQKNAERAKEEIGRAHQALEMGDASAAATALRSALTLDPTSHQAAWEGAQGLFKLGDAAQTRALAQKAVEIRPDHVPSLVLLGTVCQQLGMNKQAKRHLETALGIDPNHAEAKRLLKKLRWV